MKQKVLVDYMKHPHIPYGWVMPFFEIEDKIYFQRFTCKKGTKTFNAELVELDLENDRYDPITWLHKEVELDLDKNLYAYLDNDNEFYIGTREYILSICKSFKSYEQYKDHFEDLEKREY